jgi:hypothetical protein
MIAQPSLASADARLATIARLNDRCRQGVDRTARFTVTRTCLGTFASGHGAMEFVVQARLAYWKVVAFIHDDGRPSASAYMIDHDRPGNAVASVWRVQDLPAVGLFDRRTDEPRLWIIASV